MGSGGLVPTLASWQLGKGVGQRWEHALPKASRKSFKSADSS